MPRLTPCSLLLLSLAAAPSFACSTNPKPGDTSAAGRGSVGGDSGAGGLPNTGGSSSGAAGTSGESGAGNGGTLATGGASGGDGGAGGGGALGGSGGSAGNAGNAGTAGAIPTDPACPGLFAQARTQLEQASTCDPTLSSGQCTGSVPPTCGCPVAVNSATSAESVAYLATLQAIKDKSCVQSCTPIFCNVPATGQCVKQIGGTSGVCLAREINH